MVTVFAVAALLVGAVAVIEHAGLPASPSGASGDGSVTWTSLPLSSSIASDSEASASLAMGHLEDPANTFWQVMARASASSAWKVATPPGIATNGGLATSKGTSGVLNSVVLPYSGLRFSSFAQSTDNGERWTRAATVPGPVLSAPDAVTSLEAGSEVAALLSGTWSVADSPSGLTRQSGQGQTVVVASGPLTHWSALTTTEDLSSVAPECHLQALTAVLAGPDGRLVVGGRCGNPGHFGLFGQPAAAAGPDALGARWTWLTAGVVVPGMESAVGISTVIRIDHTVTGLGLLLGTTREGRRALVYVSAPWPPGDDAPGSWSFSPFLPVPPGWSLVATGTGTSTLALAGAVVLLRHGAALKVLVTGAGGVNWTSTPPPPSGTTDVVLQAGTVTALVPAGSDLSTYRWIPGTTIWTKRPSVTVSIQYGSSN